MKEGAQENNSNAKVTEVVEKQLKFQIGGYTNQVQAKADAQDFMRPTVFQYRSAFFPDPRNFQLTITPKTVEVKQWPKPPSPMNTLYIELTLDVSGLPGMIDEWERRVFRAIKAFMPESWGDETDRAKHLKETNREDPRTSGVQAPVEGAGLGGDRAQHLHTMGIKPYPKEGAKQAPAAKPTILEGLD